MQAHRQWMSRTPDERFTSLIDMQDFKRRFRDNSRSQVITSRGLNVRPVEDDARALQIMEYGNGLPAAAPTHWSFGRLNSTQALLTEAKAAYRAKASALTGAKAKLTRAKNDMAHATLEEQRAASRAETARAVAGLSSGSGSGINVALDAMTRTAQATRDRAAALEMKGEIPGVIIRLSSVSQGSTLRARTVRLLGSERTT